MADKKTRALLASRGKDYGKFEDNAQAWMTLQAAAETAMANNRYAFTSVQKAAITHICSKLSRVVCGNPNYPDSWRDIAGYATLGAQGGQEEKS